jgi:hypothetical protein
MRKQIHANKNGKTERTDSALKAIIFTLALMIGILGVEAQSLQSPKGAELFSSLVAAPKKMVQIGWSYPVNFETPDLVFKVYHSTDLHLPLQQWSLLTNLPGNTRSATIVADQPQEFFVMTASNSFGESNFATK